MIDKTIQQLRDCPDRVLSDYFREWLDGYERLELEHGQKGIVAYEELNDAVIMVAIQKRED